MISAEAMQAAKTLVASQPQPTQRQTHIIQQHPTSVSELSLEAELVVQYSKTRQLMDDTLNDSETPANQKAQVANSVVSALAQLIKLQEDLRKQEILKIMEGVLIEVLQTLPTEVRDKFFAEYERRAAQAGLM